MPAHRQVVITGLGAVSAAGVGVSALWRALLEGRSGVGPITRFDTTGMDSTIAGEVRNFDPAQLMESRLKPRRLSRQAQFAVVAASEAVRDAGLDVQTFKPRRVGVIVGSASGGLEAITESAVRMQVKGVNQGNPSIVTLGNLQSSALAVAELLHIEDAFAMGVSNACISGLDAVMTAASFIRSGRFDIVICGGSDAPISRTPWAEFTLAGLNATRNEEPHRAVRPFDRERETGLLGEGSGIVILESLENAQDRGARPYAMISGDHSCVDSDKSLPGSGLVCTMRGAMENASCQPKDIDFISAWGCGHPTLDRLETAAIKEVFGLRAYDVAVGSIKGVIANPLAAAGPLQLVAMGMSHRHGLLPPTVNYEYGDMDCDLDYLHGAPRRATLRKSILNAHGMGGGNTSMVLSKPD